MKTLLFLVLALGLAACANAPQTTPLQSAPARAGGIAAFGTLASFGTFEMELAPAYTRLAVLRHNAARALDNDRISVGLARDIQAGADEARGYLDRARELNGKSPARDLLAEAARRMDELETKLRDAQR